MPNDPKAGNSKPADSRVPEPPGKSGGLSRRSLLRGAAAGAALRTLLRGAGGAMLGAGGTSLIGAEDARAQLTGLEPDGGRIPFRLPLGALDFLDRHQYIHNMTIHAHLPGVMIVGAEPLMNLWAKGARRTLPAGKGFVDISDPRKPAVLAADAFEGSLPGVIFNTRLKKWILTTAAQAPITSPTPQHPLGRLNKVLLQRSTSFKGLRGIRTYDITDPEKPRLLEEFSTGTTGNGTHMNFYDGGRYAYLDCGWDDQLRMEAISRPFSNALLIVDLSDPANVKEVSRWWVPGQRYGEEAEYKNWVFANDQSSWSSSHGAPVVPKRIEEGGTIGYGGFGAFGMFVFDFSDIRKPKVLGRAAWEFEPMGGIPYHTCYPVISDAEHPHLQNLIVTTTETLFPDHREPYHTPHVVDVRDPRNPRVIGLFPRPAAPPGAPYPDFALARGRFGSHNPQAWVAPGRMRPELVALSFFNAGLRVFDISDPTAPKEVAWFVPPQTGTIDDYESWWRGSSETVFVEWDRNLIWLGTHGGSYCLSTPALGRPVLEPRKIERWSVPHCNVGWDDQTPHSVYYGRSRSRVRETTDGT